MAVSSREVGVVPATRAKHGLAVRLKGAAWSSDALSSPTREQAREARTPRRDRVRAVAATRDPNIH